MPMRPATAIRSVALIAIPGALLTALAAAPATHASAPPASRHVVQARSGARAGQASARLAATSTAPDLATLVNPLIGTARGGDTFPGADTPFGMLQWSPDTASRPNGGGYSASSAKITGFSLVHMSGPGCKFGGDVPVLPTLGAVRPAAADSYRRSRQEAQAGYYSVHLADGIRVQLTATTRTGLAEFSFPAGRRGNLIFKLNDSQNGDSAVTFKRVSATVVRGSVTSRNASCGHDEPYRLYFEMHFSRRATGYGTLATPAGPRAAASRTGPARAYLRFPAGAPVLAKVGISYVSAANATANLAAEDPGWSFSGIKSAAQAHWNALLGKVAVTGGTHAHLVVFYTALYHALLAPSVFSDDNGQYRGADGKIHRLAAGQAAEYTNFSGWDIYRAQAQLEALLDPSAASGAAQSLVNAYDQTGMLPRWQAYGRETYIMVGDPADAILADYYAFGARQFNVSAALAAMIRQATRPGNIRPGLNYLDSLGYLPEDGIYRCCANYHGRVATTLEYDTDDFAISALAGARGNAAARKRFRKRAHDWHNLLNLASKLMQPRLADGSWEPGFSPTSETGFVEGDSWQYTGMVPFDVAGLAAAKGGKAAMTRYLNQVLSRFDSGDEGRTANMTNEPSIELPWEYDYIGKPYATQRAVRRIQDRLWHDAPDGIPGNDDLGGMSAWFVWSALGMYPMTPGTATLALGSPLFRRAVIHLSSGHSLRIIGTDAGTTRPYVRSATWNGASWTRAYAPAAAITAGGTLAFRLGSSPARGWAARPADAPPSYGP
ncbi:MAG TPA: GH92 family glycosyl hydrolase [Streptosporangiaceae bacterium]|nr:GH92 family glycosyl hydrolase [Streptosporangiaceae bacterium]